MIHLEDCTCIECRPIIRGESETVLARLPRSQRRRLGERLIEWWCSHANPPSWPPAPAEPSKQSRRDRRSRHMASS